MPHIQSSTTYARQKGDGFLNEYSRRIGHAAARAQGVNPNGKMFVGSLCREGVAYDPRAWVDQSDAKDQIKRVLTDEGMGAQGQINTPLVERDPVESGPYRPRDSLVERKVEEIVERDHGGKLEPKKRRDLFEATAERMAGKLGEIA